jgi:hypothetical protein
MCRVHFKLSIIFITLLFRVSSKKQSDLDEETLDFGEFKLAIRAMRTAYSFAMPWNYSILALEGFFLQNNFCYQDLEKVDKKAAVLVKFTDYVIQQNADRWRDSEPFLTTGTVCFSHDVFSHYS